MLIFISGIACLQHNPDIIKWEGPGASDERQKGRDAQHLPQDGKTAWHRLGSRSNTVCVCVSLCETAERA